MKQDEQATRPLCVLGHTTVKTGMLRWTCPKCGQEHERDVRPMVAARAAAEWYECPTGAGGYYVAISYQAEARLRRIAEGPEQ